MMRSFLCHIAEYSLGIVPVLVLCLVTDVSLMAQPGEELLSAAIYEEEIRGDLEKAIELYSKIIENTANDRKIMAEAYYRLGFAHEKLGTKNAVFYYGELIAKFEDQPSMVKKAESRLKVLTKSQRAYKASNLSLFPSEQEDILITSKVFSLADFYGTISHDGQYFSFVNWETGNLELFDRTTGRYIGCSTGADYNMGNWVDRSIWSPDNKKILFCWIQHSVNSQLKVFDVQTDAVSELTPVYENAILWPLEWSKDGAFVLCSFYDRMSETYSVVLVSAVDGNMLTIKNFEKGEKCGNCLMSLSPDAKYIIYDRIPDKGASDLHLITSDGSEDRPLLSNPSRLRIAKWLDNDNFIYYNDASGANALWKASLTKEKRIASTELVKEGLTPEYFPVGLTDEGTFYYLQSSNIGDIFTCDLDIVSRNLEPSMRVMSDNPQSRFSPFWSPDGLKLTYFRAHDAFLGYHDIVILDLQSGNEQTLSFELSQIERRFAREHNGGWSPDGDKLIFSYWDFHSPQVILVDPITEEYEDIQVNSWEKTSGKKGEIYYINVDTTRSTVEKFIPANGEKTIIYTSTYLYVDHLSVSNKGDKLAFVVRTSLSAHGSDHLKIVDLENGITNELVSFNGRNRISDFAGLNWLHNDKEILLSVTTKEQSIQQLYSADVNTGTLVPIGDAIKGEDNYMRAIRLHPTENKLCFGRLRMVKNIWSLENLH